MAVQQVPGERGHVGDSSRRQEVADQGERREHGEAAHRHRRRAQPANPDARKPEHERQQARHQRDGAADLGAEPRPAGRHDGEKPDSGRSEDGGPADASEAARR